MAEADANKIKEGLGQDLDLVLHSMAGQILEEYARNIIGEVRKKSKESQGDSESEVILTICENRCQAIIDDIEKKKEALTDLVILKHLKDIAQAVLDFTYIEECKLVEEEFPRDTAYCCIKQLLDSMTSLLDLAKEVSNNEPSETLTPDVVECIWWRKGALLYMYCHILNSQIAEAALPVHYAKCLEDGIAHLICMLSVRSVPDWLSGDTRPEREDSEENDKFGHGASQLIAQGIYSDTHLLALMYCGEMCYWHTQAKGRPSGKALQGHADDDHLRQEAASNVHRVGALDLNQKNEGCEEVHSDSGLEAQLSGNEHSTEEENTEASTCPGTRTVKHSNGCDLIKIGKLCLEKYVAAAKGEMALGGWSTERAEEILMYFSAR